jgi:hypothetical protein
MGGCSPKSTSRSNHMPRRPTARSMRNASGRAAAGYSVRTFAQRKPGPLLPPDPSRLSAPLWLFDHGAVEKADVVVTPHARWIAMQLASDRQRRAVSDPPSPAELRTAASTVDDDGDPPRAAFAADRVPCAIVEGSPRANGHSSREAPKAAEDATPNHVDLEHAARGSRLPLLDDVLVTAPGAQPDDHGEAAPSRVEARAGDPHESLGGDVRPCSARTSDSRSLLRR